MIKDGVAAVTDFYFLFIFLNTLFLTWLAILRLMRQKMQEKVLAFLLATATNLRGENKIFCNSCVR